MNDYGCWDSPSIYELNEKKSKRFTNSKIDKIKETKMVTNSKIDKIKEKQATTTINRNARIQSKSEIDYTMDGSVKQLFLNLTRMQIPFDYEQTLVNLFPKGMKKDLHGNYFIKIGDSKSMFCGHLDTYCYEYKKVFHVIDNNIIKTDGTTTLGGDDKAGIVIMINMINAGIQGLYYFFRGEEGVTSPTGTWGSKQALKTYEDIFKTYERCVAFDRRGKSSVITQQMYSFCCSDEFAGELIEEFKKNGLEYNDDPTGMWCDSGVFMDLIPECTNISVGYKDEHTFHEEQDIEHLEKLVKACVNINWEKLPTKRDPNEVKSIGRYKYDKYNSWERDYDNDYYNNGHKTYKTYDDYEDIYKDKYVKKYKTMSEVFDYVVILLAEIGYSCLNPDDFKENDEMYFQNYETTEFFAIKIVDYDIYMSQDEKLTSYDFIGNIDTFEKFIDLGSDDDSKHISEISKPDKKEIEEIYFTGKQDKIFTEFSINNPDILTNIFDYLVDNDSKELDNKTWMYIDNKMYKYGIKLDYNIKGINADVYVDWIFFNWSKCEKIKKDYEKDQKTSITLPFKENEDGLIFTEYQRSVFSNITLLKKSETILQFIKQVVDKGFVDRYLDYIKYKLSIESWITESGFKTTSGINYIDFIDWIKVHRDNIMNLIED